MRAAACCRGVGALGHSPAELDAVHQRPHRQHQQGYRKAATDPHAFTLPYLLPGLSPPLCLSTSCLPDDVPFPPMQARRLGCELLALLKSCSPSSPSLRHDQSVACSRGGPSRRSSPVPWLDARLRQRAPRTWGCIPLADSRTEEIAGQGPLRGPDRPLRAFWGCVRDCWLGYHLPEVRSLAKSQPNHAPIRNPFGADGLPAWTSGTTMHRSCRDCGHETRRCLRNALALPVHTTTERSRSTVAVEP